MALCADDYGLSAPVSEGILALAEAGRLQAISCMTDSPRWAVDGALLGPLSTVELGLHVNFTEAFATARPVMPLTRLLVASWLRRLDPVQVRQSVSRQWQQFEDVVGRAPDFVDGHQHVHQFPVIRDALLAEASARGFHGWVRSLANLRPTPGMAGKILVLRLLGAGRLRSLLGQHRLSSNRAFGGVYDFSPQADYRALMQGWLADCPEGALLMCHPALAGADDGIAAVRLNEFTYLESGQFLLDCQDHEVQLATVTEML